MNDYVVEIRNKSGMTQQLLAESLGVSFATVNRWENGKTSPDKMAQIMLYEFCINHQIALEGIIRTSVGENIDLSNAEGGWLKIFHGSKTGITGKIGPVSREKCDFGAGFYMGESILQPLQLISDYDEATLYTIKMKLDDLTIKQLMPGIEWAMVIAANRGKIDKKKYPGIYKRYSSFLAGVDVCIGPIADDRIFYVINNFFDGHITDVALVESLKAMNYGHQYVALTQKACDNLSIIEEHKVSLFERKALAYLGENNRQKGIASANEICRLRRREGLYFDELLDEWAKEDN